MLRKHIWRVAEFCGVQVITHPERSNHFHVDNLAIIAIIDHIMKPLAAPIDPILSELHAFDASTVKNRFRDVAERAATEAVAISRYNRPEFVIMSAEEYIRLERLRRAPLDLLTGQFDALVAKMQTGKSQKAVRKLFRATPASLGKAALKAAGANGC